jgi:hypothetical protein
VFIYSHFSFFSAVLNCRHCRLQPAGCVFHPHAIANTGVGAVEQPRVLVGFVHFLQVGPQESLSSQLQLCARAFCRTLNIETSGAGREVLSARLLS